MCVMLRALDLKFVHVGTQSRAATQINTYQNKLYHAGFSRKLVHNVPGDIAN